MSILDKKYKLIKLDIVQKIYNDLNMIFSLSDNETSDFYLKITKNLVDIDLTDFSIVLWIKKPDGTTLDKTITQNIEDGLFYCNLENKYKNQEGIYTVQAYIEDPNTLERVATIGTFSYSVNNDILNERKDPVTPSGQIEVSYNADEKAIVFNCDAEYNAETNTVTIGGI